MHRNVSLAAILAAALVAGCGQPSSTPAPAPSFKPQVTTPAVQGTAPAERSDLTEGDQPADESSLTSADEAASQEIPAEEKAEMTDDAATDEAATPASTGDDQAVDGGAIDDENTPAASPKSKGSSGKLLRGLGNSLGRALSKSAGSGGKGSAKARPAPKLEDDPFPNGEPNDTKPKD